MGTIEFPYWYAFVGPVELLNLRMGAFTGRDIRFLFKAGTETQFFTLKKFISCNPGNTWYLDTYGGTSPSQMANFSLNIATVPVHGQFVLQKELDYKVGHGPRARPTTTPSSRTSAWTK